ncbi:DUF551 domain-containing protein [Escherichia coli]
MSTITRELAKLFRKITNSEIDAEGNAHVVLSPADSLLINNARIALASLEAEPVAWLLSGGGAKNNVSFDSGNAYADPLREVTPLYASPPAPVSVPAAMEMDDDFDSAFEHGKAVGWNACRAAMLQGAEPVSQAYKLNALDGNSPVTPDGWISCSERMPDDGQHVIILCDGAFVLYAQYRDGEFFDIVRNGDEFFETQSRNVTDWMRLPEPPQEVNRG